MVMEALRFGIMPDIEMKLIIIINPQFAVGQQIQIENGGLK